MIMDKFFMIMFWLVTTLLPAGIIIIVGMLAWSVLSGTASENHEREKAALQERKQSRAKCIVENYEKPEPETYCYYLFKLEGREW